MMNFRSAAMALMCGVALAAAPALADDNVAANPGFDGAVGAATTFTNGCCNYYGGDSAAAGWLVWNNDGGTTTATEILGATHATGGETMLHVTTSGEQNGVYQYMGGFSFASVWVKALSGTAWLSVYINDGDTQLAGAFSDPNNHEWQRLDIAVPLDGNGNQRQAVEIALYSAPGSAGGDFYFDEVYAGHTPLAPVPEPGEWAMVIAGLGVVGAAARRRRGARNA